MLTVNLGDLDFLLLRCTTTPELEISSFTSRRSTKVSSGSAKDDAECSDVVNFLESQLLKGGESGPREEGKVPQTLSTAAPQSSSILTSEVQPLLEASCESHLMLNFDYI